MKIKSLLPILFIALSACQSVSGSTRQAGVNLKTIDVYRSDGSRQCSGSGIAPETMQADLGDIRVHAARKDSLRGVAFPAVCGGATGSVNVYTINQSDLAKAQQRGFAEFKIEE